MQKRGLFLHHWETLMPPQRKTSGSVLPLRDKGHVVALVTSLCTISSHHLINVFSKIKMKMNHINITQTTRPVSVVSVWPQLTSGGVRFDPHQNTTNSTGWP